ncbi:MAG: UDP-N-acetylglucosamine 1-carboxyvinyltransferase [Holosporaceae bacterium]|jgi:UDP-N-acetylglucosamine 1-carboxyvinyltransferase|nr:UDP-N-acetylglucosamine 1-carboxyvinyltransferase [Holosporaceae bacterium]
MTEKIRIRGKQIVNGVVPISGAKNAALPLLAAVLLSSEKILLRNVPPLEDVRTMLSLLDDMGVRFHIRADSSYASTIELQADAVNDFRASYDIVKRMRASILVLGPLLARFGECSVSLPGGCAIGVRPVDLHLKGVEALGATVSLKDGYIHARSPRGLRGTEYRFPISTVTGTENMIMAAALADGKTILENAAQEPEVVDLANCLNKMGACISGHGSGTIEIDGVANLHGVDYAVGPDRIEAGTYAIAAGITNGCVDLMGGNFRELLPCFVEKMTEAGLVFTDIGGGLRVESSGKISPIDIETAPYPGYPTDLQAQSMALLCIAAGISNIHENIWENRFMHVAELARMGANIKVASTHARIYGVEQLQGAPVYATDLRASFSLVLAALAAEGVTVLDRVYHLDRGYCKIEKKFAGCGVKIERFR